MGYREYDFTTHAENPKGLEDPLVTFTAYLDVDEENDWVVAELHWDRKLFDEGTNRVIEDYINDTEYRKILNREIIANVEDYDMRDVDPDDYNYY